MPDLMDDWGNPDGNSTTNKRGGWKVALLILLPVVLVALTSLWLTNFLGLFDAFLQR